MLFEFIEVLFGDTSLQCSSKEGEKAVAEVRPGQLSTRTESTVASDESESDDDTEDSDIVDPEAIVNTEVNVKRYLPAKKQVSALTDVSASQSEELGTLGTETDTSPLGMEVTHNAMQQSLLSWEEEEEETETGAEEDPVEEAQMKKKNHTKTEECIRQLHLRDECLKEKLEKQRRTNLENEKKLKKKEMQMIFAQHKQQAQANADLLQGQQLASEQQRKQHDLGSASESTSNTNPQAKQLTKMIRSGEKKKSQSGGKEETVKPKRTVGQRYRMSGKMT